MWVVSRCICVKIVYFNILSLRFQVVYSHNRRITFVVQKSNENQFTALPLYVCYTRQNLYHFSLHFHDENGEIVSKVIPCYFSSLLLLPLQQQQLLAAVSVAICAKLTTTKYLSVQLRDVLPSKWCRCWQMLNGFLYSHIESAAQLLNPMRLIYLIVCHIEIGSFRRHSRRCSPLNATWIDEQRNKKRNFLQGSLKCTMISKRFKWARECVREQGAENRFDEFLLKHRDGGLALSKHLESNKLCCLPKLWYWLQWIDEIMVPNTHKNEEYKRRWKLSQLMRVFIAFYTKRKLLVCLSCPSLFHSLPNHKRGDVKNLANKKWICFVWFVFVCLAGLVVCETF